MNIIRKESRKNSFLRTLKKMVFLTNPRQIGKTWLANEIAGSFTDSVYLNYGSLEERKIIKKEAWLPKAVLLILDEVLTRCRDGRIISKVYIIQSLSI